MIGLICAVGFLFGAVAGSYSVAWLIARGQAAEPRSVAELVGVLVGSGAACGLIWALVVLGVHTVIGHLFGPV